MTIVYTTTTRQYLDGVLKQLQHYLTIVRKTTATAAQYLDDESDGIYSPLKTTTTAKVVEVFTTTITATYKINYRVTRKQQEQHFLIFIMKQQQPQI